MMTNTRSRGAGRRTLRLAALTTLLATLLIACGTTSPPPGGSDGGIAPPDGTPIEFATSRDAEQTSFDLTNTADRALDWRLEIDYDPSNDNPEGGAWFTADPRQGTIPGGESQTLTLTLESDLTDGSYDAELAVVYNGDRTEFTVQGVVGDAGFDIRLGRSELSLAPLATAEVDVELIDFNEPIEVDVEDAPPGVTATIVDNDDPNDTTVLLRIETGNNAESGDVTVIARAQQSGALRRATLALTITDDAPQVEVEISPTSVTLEPGATQDFAATVTGATDTGVTWSATCGTFDTTGNPATYRAPNSEGTCEVTATSVEDPTASATAVVTVEIASTGALEVGATTVNADVPVAPPSGTSLLAARSADQPFVPGQLLVAYSDDAVTLQSVQGADGELRSETAAEARLRLATEVRRAYGLTLVRDRGPQRADVVQLPSATDPRASAARLMRDPRIAWAEPNWLVESFGVPNDPRTDDLWQLPIAGLPLAWEARDASGSGVVIAVIDSGIDLDHPDLDGRFVSGGYDFCDAFDGSDCSRDDDVRPSSSGDRHGTHVTGLVGAEGNNNVGVAGAVPGAVELLPVKVFEAYGISTPVSVVADTIRWAAGETIDGIANPDPAQIINLSLGLNSDSSALRNAVEAAQSRGALLVAAAGNSSPSLSNISSLAYPARYPGVVSVGSVNSALERSCFSRYPSSSSKRGEHLMLPGGDQAELDAGSDGEECPGAPDEAVLSTVPSGYGVLKGTSQAAPVAAGIAALIWAEQGTSASASSVRSALLGAGWLPDGASRTEFGRGVLRADLAFGFPGPGDAVAVDVSGPESRVGTLTLDPFGGSTRTTFRDLPTGSYTVNASSEDAARTLDGQLGVEVEADRTRDATIRLTR